MSIDKCNLRPSKHARDKMSDEAINKDRIKEIIRFGTKRFQRDKIIASMGNIEIIYKLFPCNIFIITLYFMVR